MTDTIDAIADLINAVGMNGTTNEDVATAILETLKARIPDLVWEDDEDDYIANTVVGEFSVHLCSGYGWLVQLDGHDDSWVNYPSDEDGFATPDEAKAAANAHNEAQALKLVGWDV